MSEEIKSSDHISFPLNFVEKLPGTNGKMRFYGLRSEKNSCCPQSIAVLHTSMHDLAKMFIDANIWESLLEAAEKVKMERDDDDIRLCSTDENITLYTNMTKLKKIIEEASNANETSDDDDKDNTVDLQFTDTIETCIEKIFSNVDGVTLKGMRLKNISIAKDNDVTIEDSTVIEDDKVSHIDFKDNM